MVTEQWTPPNLVPSNDTDFSCYRGSGLWAGLSWVVLLPYVMTAGVIRVLAAAQVLLGAQKSQNMTFPTFSWLKQPQGQPTPKRRRKELHITVTSGRCTQKGQELLVAGLETFLLDTQFQIVI